MELVSISSLYLSLEEGLSLALERERGEAKGPGL